MEERSAVDSHDSTSTTNLKDENNRLNEQIQLLEVQLIESKDYTFNELQKQRKEFDNRVAATQEEIKILQGLVNEQKQQLITAYTEHEDDVQDKVKQITELGLQVQKLRAELEKTEQRMGQANEVYAESLKTKVDELTLLLNENKELRGTQAADLSNKQETIETLNQQIMDLYAAMETQGNELNDKDDEINRMQDIIDEHAREIRILKERSQTYEKRIKDAEVRVADKETEITKVRTELETKNKEQLEKLKKFAANLKKKNAQYLDLEAKYKELESGGGSSGDATDHAKREHTKDNAVTEKLLEEQKNEIQRLQQQVNEFHLESRKESVALQQSAPSVSVYDHLAEVNDLKESVTHLEVLIDGRNAEITSLQQNVQHSHAELENIKLRLSEKVLLVDQLTAETQSKSAEIIELRDSLGRLNEVKVKLEETEADLKSKNIKIEKCKAVIKEKNKEIKRLGEQVQILTDQQLPQADVHTDITIDIEHLKQEKQALEQEFDAYKLGTEAKAQESALFAETLESENNQLKDRIGRLEESICSTEERRASLERTAELLGSQLLQKESQIENAEDEYMDRLQAIVGQDEIIEQKLKDLESERDALCDSLRDLRESNAETLRQTSALQARLNELESVQLQELENDNKLQCEQIARLESDLQRQSMEFERTLAVRLTEFTDLENELSNHLKEVEKERRAQREILEKCHDENSTLRDELCCLQELKTQLEQSQAELSSQVAWHQLQAESISQDQLETQELRMQVVQDQTEVENLRTQSQEMARDHEAALNSIRQQLADVQAAYDAIFATHLAELQQVESLRANAQLVEASLAAAQSDKEQLASEMDTLKSQICHDQTDLVNLRLQNQQLTSDHDTELAALRLRISELSANHAHAEQEHLEVQNLRAQKQELENELAALREQVTALDSMQMHVGQNITQDQLEVQQLRTQVGHDQTEIEALRAQMQQLTSSHDSELAALRQQIAELDSLRMQVGQNQTDDQVFIQNENERLQAVLAEKELEIQNYQRQNLQLQMLAGPSGAATGVNASPFDPFAAINTNVEGESSVDATNVTALVNRVAELESQLEAAMQDTTIDQQFPVRIPPVESAMLVADCVELQRQLCEKDVEIARLQDIHQQLLSSLPADDHDHTAFGGSGRHAPPEPPIHNINFLEVTTAPATADAAFAIPSSVTSHPPPASVEHHDQQIEDLQRNVSDLEKYVTDLEHKLKSATEENLKCTNDRFMLENTFAGRTVQYEERIAALDQQIDALRNELTMLSAEQQIVQSPADIVVENRSRAVEAQPLQSASIFFAAGDAEDDPFGTVGMHSQAGDAVDADEPRAVVEETIVPKKAYLCYPTDESAERQTFSPHSVHTDDAWGESGWGGDEAALEEEHQRLAFTENQSRGLNTAEVKLQLQVMTILRFAVIYTECYRINHHSCHNNNIIIHFFFLPISLVISIDR